MTENKRFTRKTVYGWEKSAFLEVMNGLDRKNQQLKKENKQLKDFIKKLADDTGSIVLMNGYGYHISKVINDD